MTSQNFDPCRDSDKQSPILYCSRGNVCEWRVVRSNVLLDEDGVPGSKFEREPEEYTVE